MSNRSSTIGALLVGVVLIVLYAPALGYSFQVDSAFWLAHRFRDPADFLGALVSLDVQGWYRPLSNRLLPSLLFPLAGVWAPAYHLLVLVLFGLTVGIVHRLLRALFDHPVAIWGGTLIFAAHPVHAWTSFGIAFLPDLLATLAAAAGALAIVRDRGSPSGRRRAWLWCLAALLCKESAVAVPLLMILVLWACHDPNISHRTRIRESLPFGLLAAAYPALVWGLLHGGVWRAGPAGYMLGVADHLSSNLLAALLWALPLQTGMGRPFGADAAPVRVAVASLWLVLAAGVALSLPQPGARRRLALGAGWFLIALGPAVLPGTITPYYLCLPLVGTAILGGQALTALAGLRLPAPLAALAAAFAPLVFVLVSTHLVPLERARQPLLAPSAARVGQAMQAFPAIAPSLDPDTTVLVLDHAPPHRNLAWHYSNGHLLRLLYDRPPRVLFTSLGETVAEPLPDSLLVIEDREGQLLDVTSAFRRDPAAFLQTTDAFEFGPVDPGLLTVHPEAIRTDFESYRLKVRDGARRRAEILFRIDGGPVAVLNVQLDEGGGVGYTAGPETRPGVYEFVGVRLQGSRLWTPTAASLVVTR